MKPWTSGKLSASVRCACCTLGIIPSGMIYCLVLETSFYHLEQHLKQCSFPLLCKQFFIDDAVFSQLFFFSPWIKGHLQKYNFWRCVWGKIVDRKYVCVCVWERERHSGRQSGQAEYAFESSLSSSLVVVCGLSSCGLWAPECLGFSSFGSWAQYLWLKDLVTPSHVGS